MTTLRPKTARNENVSSQRHIPGEEGTWIFIFGDMTIFSALFGSYLYYRGRDPETFRSSQAELLPIFGVVNTLLLLTSSYFVISAVRAVRADRLPQANRLVAAATTLGICFVLNKGVEYTWEVMHGRVPATDQFFLYYYIMTGLHLLHVIVGLVLLGIMWRMTRNATAPLGKRQNGYLVGAGCVWHMVDLLWIVIFPLLYLVK
jgi:nitric oxide reductase NorE protein